MVNTPEKSLDLILNRLQNRLSEIDETTRDMFLKRLRKQYPRFFSLFYELYGSRYDFFYHLEEAVLVLLRMWNARSRSLKKRDIERPRDWFLHRKTIGAMCYVDKFAGTFKKFEQKIPYLKNLGISYLHLLPLFDVPEKQNDGGYAVRSYRKVRSDLGSMDDLNDLIDKLHSEGIALVLDFVFNHTSREHEWAKRAEAGEKRYRDFYFFFQNQEEFAEYAEHLRDIFPEVRNGSFSYLVKTAGWVWSTFHDYQWDLNYANPEVFCAMLEEMLFLSNLGTDVLRLDALAFTWKEAGTSCENLPKAHCLVQAFKSGAAVVAPNLLFKSEAIVHPDEVNRYIGTDECDLSYNPLLMALLWESLATRKVNLLLFSMKKRFAIPENCNWVNYIRCHDDIGWTFSDEDAAVLGINGLDHRSFLNNFYTGEFDGSFARGLPFQQNSRTGDIRISGTCASLAGLEKGVLHPGDPDVEFGIRRILLVYGIIFSIGGIPLINLGDEVGMLNDYSYLENPVLAEDSRWVHRSRHIADHKPVDTETLSGRIYYGLENLVRKRSDNPAFMGHNTEFFDTGNQHVLGFLRTKGVEKTAVLANFREHPESVNSNCLRLCGFQFKGQDLITGKVIQWTDHMILDPLQLLWINVT